MQNTNTVSSVSVETLKAQEAALRAVKAELKAAQKRSEWEQATKAANPQFVMGSVRKPTSEDEAELGHTHGLVCSIECETCGTVRTVNLQDAKQCRFCKECKKGADKAKASSRRMDKRLAGKSVSDLQAEIAEAQAALEALKSAAA